ncbi:MAG: alpha/beta fold hydrolase [Acidimicrobiales bacterium]
MTAASPTGLAVWERGTGTPVVLVHGQPGSARTWEPVVQRLPSDLWVLVPDRPGYGRTLRAAGGLEENAAVLAGELERRRASPAVVVGHSYGGGIALLLAARRPELVAGLVLVGSIGGRGSVNTLDHLLAVPGAGEALAAAGLVATPALATLRKLAVGLTGGRRMLAARLASTLPDGDLVVPGGEVARTARSFAVEQRALVVEAARLEGATTQVSAPTTVVSGTWDTVVPPSAQAALARAVDGARLVRLEGVGHFVARDAPDLLAAIVEEVARSVAGRVD